MKDTVLKQIAEYSSVRKRRKRWFNVVACLATVVVFCTAYALMLPAITEETEVFCAQEEHCHDEACYIVEDVCVAHEHTDACMETEMELSCALEESEGHTHAPECYGESEILVCELVECESHAHSEACVQMTQELTCSLTEDENHAHSEACYAETQSYICGFEESGGHIHGEACYQAAITLLCPLAESEGHCHSEECYEEKNIFVCGFDEWHECSEACSRWLVCEAEEHTHGLSCYSDPQADLENAEIWERSLPDVLTQKYAEDLLAVAKTQLGYQESENNYIVTQEGEKKGYTRYGQWYGDAYGDWDAVYVAFCLYYANIEDLSREADCQSWVELLAEKGIYRSAADHRPKAGDIIFFDYDGDVKAEHVGIVESVEDGICTIEGDVFRQVSRCSYDSLDQSIMGYGVLPENKGAVSYRGLEGSYTQAGSAYRLRTLLNTGTSHIRLSANISTSDAITLPSNCDIVLDLNGFTLTHTGSSAFLAVGSGRTITVWDSKAAAETLSEADGEKYDRIGTLSGTTLNYYVTETRVVAPLVGTTEETLRLHTVSAAGAIKAGTQPVFSVSGGTVNVESGMIYGGSNRAVYMTSGTVNLNGGYLCGFTQSFNANTNDWNANPSTEFGGAAYLSGGTLNCNGAVLAVNTAADGGAVCVCGGTLNITGGVLSGNRSLSVREDWDSCPYYNGGGAVFANGNGTVTMSGGYITNNSVLSDDSYWDGGGGVLLDDNASFTLSGGYLTGNIAHGGGAVRTCWLSKSKFVMTGGFLTGNVARKAEGGALFLGMEEGGADDVGGAVITAGYVTNNKIIETEHWGGGGLFCSDGASLEVRNMLLTQNTAAGFGGGLAGCSTGHIFLYSNDGCAIYGNEDCVEGEPHFSGDASDKPYDKQICDEVFQSYDHSDYFCALESAISGEMLGGHPAYWTGSADGIPVNSGEDDVLSAEKVMGLTAHPTQEAILTAEQLAKLYVTGNHSDTHGGGVLCNGVLKVGGPLDIEVPVRLIPDIAKLFVDGNGEKISLEGFEFTAVITDELGNVISTAACQEDGSFLFGNEIVLRSEGTYTYYLKELNDGLYESIQYDTSVYRITVKVIKGEPIAIDSESTKVYYYTTLVTMERRAADGTWKTINTIDGSYFGSVVLPLFGDAYAFTNILSDKTSIQVVKKWTGEPGANSVTVDLYRNDAVIATQTLSSSNSWQYTWQELPVTDESGSAYLYTVRERSIEGYSVEYITTAGGSDSKVYWIPATELVEGEQYIIANPNGGQILYATDSSIDAAYTTSDKKAVSRSSGSLSLGGKTYSTWYEGNMDARSVYTAVVPSDFSQKNGNTGLTLKNNGTSSSSWMLVQDAGGNYLKGTNNDTYCSLFVVQDGMLKGHDGFTWNPNNLRTVVYSGNKFTTTTGTSNAAGIYRKVTTLSVSGTQTVTIVNTPVEEARFEVNLTKLSELDQKPLVGAEFALLNEQGQALYFTGENGRYALSNETQAGATTCLVTATGGKLLLQELPAGSYTLRETKAPSNHAPIPDYNFTLGDKDGEKTLYLTVEDPVYAYVLPETGGIGMQWYTLGGLLLILAGAIPLYRHRKRRKEDFTSS